MFAEPQQAVSDDGYDTAGQRSKGKCQGRYSRLYQYELVMVCAEPPNVLVDLYTVDFL